MPEKIDNEILRALSGVILLILSIVYIFANNSNNAIEYILMALAGFLVGGALLALKK